VCVVWCVLWLQLCEMLDARGSIPIIVTHLECFPFCELLYDVIVIVEAQQDKIGLIEVCCGGLLVSSWLVFFFLVGGCGLFSGCTNMIWSIYC
jgi:hypothetical protein